MLRKALMTTQADQVDTGSSKVSVVGVGQVGMACAFSLMLDGTCNELALVDLDANRVQGEVLDMQHGGAFIRRVKVYGSSDYAVTAKSRVVIVTAGVRQKEGETRLSLVQRNADVMKMIIPQIIKYSPDTILLMVSNPVDIMTYVAWKISGLPRNRVIGSGTNLDSARFRFFIAERLNVAPASVHGWIIGEHGDSSVAVWSGVNVAGVRLRDLNPNIGTDNDPEKWTDLHVRVIKSAYEVISLKGYTSWAIGLSTNFIVKAILGNTLQVMPVSTYIKGCKHGMDKEVFLSLPCVLGENGVTHIIKQPLTDEEKAMLHKSANLMHEIQMGIKF